MREYIIMIASIVTAITVISSTCFKVYIFFRNLEKKYDEMNDILKNNTLFILKIAVLDEQLPLTDRLKAGELYMNLGGNGAVKKKYQELLKEYN